MARLALLAALFAGVAAASQFATPTVFQKRAGGVTGCSCCGLDVSFGSDMDNMETIFILNWADGEGSANAGYCFVDGELEQVYVNAIGEAINSQTSNPYVNITGANRYCSMMGYGVGSQTCIDNVVDKYHDWVVGDDGTWPTEWIHTECVYPSANFVPTDCYCNFECSEGFVQCGTECIDPAVSQCASGVPQSRSRRSTTPGCPSGFDLCPVPLKGFDCLDVSSNLEACGACPFHPGSVDCTTLPGVDAVNCVNGACVIESCTSRFTLVDGKCDLK